MQGTHSVNKLALALSFALTIGACRKADSPSADPTPADPVAAQPAPAAAAADPAAPKSISSSTEITGLIGRMQYEAAHRPGTGVAAERVFAALDHAGIALTRMRQYAGFSMKAAYCAGGSVGEVPISVCEYPTPAAAAAGKAFMDKELASRGVRALRGTTLLNVANNDGDVAKRAVAAFNTL